MSLTRTILRNIASSWAGYAVHASVAFVLTPYILHSLGEARYGIWALAVGLTGYYGLLDLGISGGIGQYLTRYLAEKQIDELNRTASTGFVALTLCGMLICFCAFAVASKASVLFHIPAEFSQEVPAVLMITGLSAALQFSFYTYSAVFTAVQRFDLSNGIGVVTRLTSAVATVFSLRMGYGLVGLSVVLAATNAIDYVIRWRCARRLLPSMKISLRLFSWHHMSEVFKYGLWNLATAGGVRLISYTDTLVIGAFMPISAIAPFALAANLRSYFEEIFVRTGFVFFPAATELDAQQRTGALQSLYLVSSRFMFLAVLWSGCLALRWSPEFFGLWVGDDLSNVHGYPSVAMLFSVLLGASIISVGQRVGYQVLQGMRRVRLLATLVAIEGLCNLVLSVILVLRVGLIGVALGTLIPTMLFQGVLHPFFVCRALKLDLSTYCRRVLLRPFLASLIALPVVFATSIPHQAAGWFRLFAAAGAGGLMILPIVFVVGMEPSERGLCLSATQSLIKKLALFRPWRRIPEI